MNKVIAQDSLLGQALADDLDACHLAAVDGSGFVDHEDLDHCLDQHDDLERWLEEAAEIAAAFAEESLRFAS